MLYGLLVYMAGSVACAASGGILSLYAATFVQAFGAACGSVVTQTMLRDVCGEKERAQVFAIIGMSLSFSPALGPLIGSGLNQSSLGQKALA